MFTEKSEQELIAPLLEICLELLHLLGADGFERERHDAGADLSLGVLALVVDVEHVRAVFGDAGEQLRQIAGAVLQLGRDLRDAAGLLHALGEYPLL